MLTRKLKSCIFILTALASFIPIVGYADSETVDHATSENLIEANYQEVLKEWQQDNSISTDFSETISAAQLSEESQVTLEEVEGRSGVELSEKQALTFTVTVPETGLYLLSMDYYSFSNSLIDAGFSVQVNGAYPFYESRRIIAPSAWVNRSDEFVTNAAGTQLIPEQIVKKKWQSLTVTDVNYFETNGLFYLLEKGENQVVLTSNSESMLVGEVTIHSPQHKPSYEEYRRTTQTGTTALTIVEAEHTQEKNNSYIRPIASNSVDVEPYDARQILLNTLGGESWSQGGQSVTWTFEVPETGNYQLTFKVDQRIKDNTPVFRHIMLDGQIPFAELENYRFEPTNNWENHTLNQEGVPYEFYLEAGTHQLTLTASAAPIANVSNELIRMMEEVSDLGLEIKKLTGNQSDRNRDWKLEEYIPNLSESFSRWDEDLKNVQEELIAIYGTSSERSPELVQLELVIDKLAKLADNPDDLPNQLTNLSEGSSAVTQNLADIQGSLVQQPLTLDRIYIHGSEADLPAATKGFTKKLTSKISEFFLSFSSPNYDIGQEEEETIEVWVARSQQYVELMQNMADSTFTKETGKKVKFSVMPNEQKLILANSSGQQPDLALGVSVGTPYELAIRGAAAELTQFDDFDAYIQKFSPGAFLPMMVDDKVYALPETQDFYVQFYRKDILNKLGIDPPDNWEEVIGILPELQRYGLNYFVPLSGSAGTKAFMFTAPFIYQFDADLYSEDGLTTAIDSENAIQGLQFMTDLYTLYSLPLQVPNFYHSFRYGSLPIGVSNFETYVKLVSAAPEIANSWDISLYPGVVSADGTINRSATGSAQSAMIFENSEKKEDAWELLKWWMSTKTQSDFAKNLQTIYGPEYMWNTANLEAFSQLPWPEEHKAVILKQWESLYEVPKTPGAYILEREISNIWTDVVFNGVNIRASIDDRVIVVNREIRRKLEEFGYVEGTKILKPYKVPKIETVEEWIDEAKENSKE